MLTCCVNLYSDSSSDLCLSLCPTDVLATLGETVFLQAAQPGSRVMRWYRQLVTSHTATVVYTGLEVDYKQLDHRYVKVKLL